MEDWLINLKEVFTKKKREKPYTRAILKKKRKKEKERKRFQKLFQTVSGLGFIPLIFYFVGFEFYSTNLYFVGFGFYPTNRIEFGFYPTNHLFCWVWILSH